MSSNLSVKASNEAERPCLPSCSDWHTSDSSKHKISNGTDIYGISGDTSNQIKAKLTQMFFAQIPLAIVRPVLRLLNLLDGDFIETGKDRASKELELEKQAWSQSKITFFPGESRRLWLIGKNVFIQLVKNVAKLVFQPLSSVGLIFASLYGILINPWDGREYFASIEYAFARDLPTNNNGVNNSLYRYSDILGVCMQPERVWVDLNLFKHVFKKYHADTLRSKLSEVNKFLINNKQYYINENINVDELLNRLSYYKNSVKDISESDASEIYSERVNKTSCKILKSFTLKNYINNSKIACDYSIELTKLISELNVIKESRNKFINKEVSIASDADITAAKSKLDQSISAFKNNWTAFDNKWKAAIINEYPDYPIARGWCQRISDAWNKLFQMQEPVQMSM